MHRTTTHLHGAIAIVVLLLALISLTPAAPAAAQERCRAFPETGQQVCGRILSYWEQNGGLPVFGYPISPQVSQDVEGRMLQVQWFERNRLELHPENRAPYDVLLGRLGVDSLESARRDWTSFPKGSASGPNYFPETGHAIAPQFAGYWSSQGLEFDGAPGKSFEESLALFGMPLSEPVVETNSSGDTVLTQWFERARFEHHPKNAGSPYEVLLGLLGADLNGRSEPAAPAVAMSDYGAQVVELINRERANAGCPALTIDVTLTQVAQNHSQDMAVKDYFDHTGADGRSPFQRMTDAGYRFKMAAENIAAGAKSPEDAVRLWMDSAGHRANILNCSLRETGVGYVDEPGDTLRYRTYWTQTFGTR